jgi:UPF0755 protein
MSMRSPRRFSFNMRFSSLMIRNSIAAVAAAVMCATLLGCGEPYGNAHRVIVPRNASFRVAAESLASAGVIEIPFAFRVYARVRGDDRTIQAGTYLLRRGMRWDDVLDALHGGGRGTDRITIPEGFSIAQITPLLVKQLNVPPESVDVAMRDSATRARLGVPAATLEGYLFPDTYVFPPGTSARQAVDEMVRRFEREWTPTLDGGLRALANARTGKTPELTRHAVVTMASIVEKEARRSEERPVIAAVYYNRLAIGMPLQADPTVQYALGQHVERVLYKDLEVESPYNTYRNPGLPPGPIASPGGPSLRAALAPAKVSYLYFVAAPDGHHEFRTSLTGHAEAIKAIRGESAARATRSSRGR